MTYTIKGGWVGRYKDQLGERFILFAGNQEPFDSDLQSVFERRGFFYNPEEVVLFAYGEYYSFCVEQWMEQLAQKLGLQENQYSSLLGLSLESDDDPNRARRRIELEKELLAKRGFGHIPYNQV